MVDLLVHYSVTCENGTRKKFIFSPNLGGAGGVTPLHLAASASGMYDIVDILTNDPQKIGVHCWRCLLDDCRQSPAAYALMRSNHSYNELVAKKLADIVNVQVSLPIRNEIEERGAVTEQNQRVILQLNKGQRSCAIRAATKY
ncbi:Squamosa promoter-binding-like protein [Ancistrocladus abbreviatus]